MSVETDAQLREILGLDTLAVVGCSTTPSKDAHRIPKYLQAAGYRIVPVNPNAETVLGEQAFDSLEDVTEPIDIVQVFRPSEEVAGIVEAASRREDVDIIWLQLGITDDEAVARAEEAGLDVVQDRCMMVEHRRLLGND